MKTLFFILAFNSLSANNMINSNITKAEKIDTKQNVVQAYVLRNGSFVQGTITVQQSSYGLKPINFSFPGYDRGSGSFYPGDKFVPLNSNNQYAVKYNFTHYISLPNFGTAYVIL
jgi:hypothetical protein